MESRDALLTRYMVGRYRLGYESLALFLAGVLFEKLIDYKLLKQDRLSPNELYNLQLRDKINHLNDNTLRNDSLYKLDDVFRWYMDSDKKPVVKKPLSMNKDIRDIDGIRKRLHNFRYLRNKVMHGKLDTSRDDEDNKNEDLIKYLWAELAPDSFHITYSHWRDEYPSESSLIGSMREHTADYLVRDIDEIDIKPKDIATPYNPKQPLLLKRDDFENMYELRRKLVPLKNFLSKTDWLGKHTPQLNTDILTSIDTTSGYIWLPLTQRDPAIRKGILSCSVSILATPLDLRIYMDFGGRAWDERNAYYDFLSDSEEYTKISEQFSNKQNLKVFDIEWYSHIFNVLPFSEWIVNKNDSINKARTKIGKHKKDGGDPITWNRLLHGYVFNILDLDENDIITFEMIEPELINIIDFYKAFKDYTLKKAFALKRGITI